MKRLLKLFKMLNKSSKLDNQSSITSYISIGLIGGLIVIGGLTYVCYQYAPIITALHGTSTIILVISFLASAVILTTGIMMLIKNMYMSSDIELLITLPFSAFEIVILRTLSFFRLALAGSLIALLLPYAGYAVATSFKVNDFIAVLLAGILIPTFMVSIVAVIVMIIMNVLKIFRNRQTLKIIGACFGFIGMCAYMFLVNTNGAKIDMNAALTQIEGITKVIKYTIPDIGFLGDFAESGNILNIVYSLLSTLVAVALFVIVSKTMYLNGALNMQDAGSGSILTDKDLDKYCEKKTVMNALISKEYHSVLRNPVYFMNNFLMGVLWPVVIVIIFKQATPIIERFLKDETIKVYMSTFSFDSFAFFTVVLSFVSLTVSIIPLMMQNIAVSSIIREGNSFSIMKQLPVSYETQLEAKRKMAENFSQISVTGYSILILLVVCVLMKISLLCCIIPIILVYITVKFSVNVGMYLGIKKANVVWNNEKEVLTSAQKVSGFAIFPIFMFAMFFPLVMIFLEFSLLVCLLITIFYGVLMFVLSFVLKKRIMIDGEKKIRRLHF